jgi:hypothetical protein
MWLGAQHGWAAAVLLPDGLDKQHAGRRVPGMSVTILTNKTAIRCRPAAVFAELPQLLKR